MKVANTAFLRMLAGNTQVANRLVRMPVETDIPVCKPVLNM